MSAPSQDAGPSAGGRRGLVAWWAQRPRVWLWGWALASGLGLAAVPVFRSGGYKAFLLLGLVQTLALGWLWLGQAREGGWWRRLGAFAAVGALPAGALVAASALFTRRCELPSGLEMMVLGYAPALLYTFGWVEALGHVPRPGLRRALVVLVWVGALGWSAWTFLHEPVYRITHPFAGMLLGPPNETPQVWSARAGWYAVELVGWSLALALGALAWGRWREAGGAELRGSPKAWGWGSLPGRVGALLVVVGLTLGLRGQAADLGYRVDRQKVEEVLRVRAKSPGIKHVMAPTVPTDARPWLVLDAEFERARQQKLFGLTEAQTPPMTIFWFRDKEQKQALTGASQTKFAKVHIGEFYLSVDGFPARTLAHEMAHVTSGAFSHTPLRVPGSLGGLWYNPGLVEGFAVAVAWSDQPLSSHEQARVALDKGRAPPLRDLFNPLGFANHNLSVAYQVAGSFLRFCLDEHGPKKLRQWYDTEDFEAAYGEPLERAEKRWKAMLRDKVALREQDLSQVERLQSRPPVSREACPRDASATGEAVDDAGGLVQAIGAEADDEVERILDERLAEGGPEGALWLERRRYEAARKHYRCELPEAAPVKLDEAQQDRYDLLRARALWAKGDRAGAEALLAKLPVATRNANEVILTRLLVRDGINLDEYLVDAPQEPLMVLTRAWDRTKHPALGYLLATRLERDQRWESLYEVTRALSWEGVEFPEALFGTLKPETERLRGVAAFALRRWDEAEVAFVRYTDLAPTQGRKSFGQTWVDRTRHFRAHKERLKADLPRL